MHGTWNLATLYRAAMEAGGSARFAQSLRLVVATLVWTNAAHAQPAYPARQIQLVVTVPPGGAADFVARMVGAKLADALGQPVIIANRAGAAGLAAASRERHRLLSDVPTFLELGHDRMDISLWYGIVAPAATRRPLCSASIANSSKSWRWPKSARVSWTRGPILPAARLPILLRL
jgi:tripartite-type tricarboxylate transporter receptor subunit TctC